MDASSFKVGQTVIFGDGGQVLTIASIDAFPRGRNRMMRLMMPDYQEPADPGDTVTFTTAIQKSHPAGESFTGTGVGITTPLKNNHKAGEAISVNEPTPGRPNRY